MRHKLLAIVAGLVLGACSLSVSVSAAPLSVQSLDSPPPVTLVAGGCGIGYHRGPYGGCRPNGFFGGPAIVRRGCPFGYRLGPYGRRCLPNY